MASVTSVSASDSALSPGQVINGTYTVERYLGGGSYGAVYEVTHRFLGTQALKLLRPDPLTRDVAKLLDEARVLVDLLHPNIIRVYDANEVTVADERLAFLTMEFLRGGTLADLRSRRVRLAVSEVRHIALQLLSALDHAHSLNPPVLHRDITLRNVLVVTEEPMHVKIADFGLAGRVHPETRLLRAAGTLHYMPPEAGWGYVTESADLYAAALVLYELVTGVSAFPEPPLAPTTTAAEVRGNLLAIKKDPPPPPSRFRSALSPSLDSTLLRALSPAPGDRFPSAAAFSAVVSSDW